MRPWVSRVNVTLRPRAVLVAGCAVGDAAAGAGYGDQVDVRLGHLAEGTFGVVLGIKAVQGAVGQGDADAAFAHGHEAERGLSGDQFPGLAKDHVLLRTQAGEHAHRQRGGIHQLCVHNMLETRWYSAPTDSDVRALAERTYRTTHRHAQASAAPIGHTYDRCTAIGAARVHTVLQPCART